MSRTTPDATAPPSAAASSATDSPRAATAEPGDVVIDVRDLQKTYPDGTKAVRGISFSVRRGEVFGIVGPNGAGKSTAIGILGTLVQPSHGQATVGGLDVVRDRKALRPRIGFALQDAGVDLLATGREFLVLQGRLYGLSRLVAQRRTTELLRLFDLEAAADKRIGGYSGGMKRRIDLASALIHMPAFILLDEPTEGLDPRSRRTLWNTLKRLNHKLDTTMVLSTHYMDEADVLCDRIAIVDQGRIVAIDTPERLKARLGGQSVLLSWGPDRSADVMTRARDALVGSSRLERDTRMVSTADGLLVYVPEAGSATPEILRALDAAGLSPDSLSIQKPSLDDVYLFFTGKTLQEQESGAAPVPASTSEVPT